VSEAGTMETERPTEEHAPGRAGVIRLGLFAEPELKDLAEEVAEDLGDDGRGPGLAH